MTTMSSDPPPLTSKADVHKFWPQSKDEVILGKHVILEQLQEHHADFLFPDISGEVHEGLWAYMPNGPFHSRADFRSYIKQCAESKDTIFWAIKDRSNSKVLGHNSFLRIDHANAVVEIGNIMYSNQLQRTVGATEAWFLLADRAFACGFRRLEWKCNALNGPSRKAALRYGHVFEGVFRQHMIVKGKNRDTAWYSLLDGDWAREKTTIKEWMDDGNFDESGKQRQSLATVRAAKKLK